MGTPSTQEDRRYQALQAAGVHEDDLRTDVLKHSTTFNRLIRADPPGQLGVPTADLAMVALGRGETDRAAALGAYMVDEFRVVFDSVLNGWLHQLIEHTLAQLNVPGLDLLLRVPRKHVWDALFAMGCAFAEDARAAIDAGDAPAADVLLDHVRRTFKTVNDETVRFIQDVFTLLGDRGGESAPVEAMRGPYEQIWRVRYASWDTLSAEEKLQLTCEGMRTHYGGPTRRGEFAIVDDGDRYRLVFAACGTGGMLRFGDPETGDGPWPTTGVNRTPEPYTWGKVGVPWYCLHCSLYMEHWAAEDHGYPIRPVLFHSDPASPVSTEWLIYKDPAQTHAEDFLRVGLEPRH